MVVCLASFCACGSFHANNDGDLNNHIECVDSKYADFNIIEESGCYTIFYDKTTKVMYICFDGNNCTAMMPIFNADGTLKLYDGE